MLPTARVTYTSGITAEVSNHSFRILSCTFISAKEGRKKKRLFPADAIPSDEQVRVCPSLHDRRGWVWSKHEFSQKNWMFDASLRITGKSSMGADGMVNERTRKSMMWGDSRTMVQIKQALFCFSSL